MTQIINQIIYHINNQLFSKELYRPGISKNQEKRRSFSTRMMFSFYGNKKHFLTLFGIEIFVFFSFVFWCYEKNWD